MVMLTYNKVELKNNMTVFYWVKAYFNPNLNPKSVESSIKP